MKNWMKAASFFVVQEGQGKFWVNLHDYLDSGLFLDHRPLRKRICAEARGKRFLNLFCYTASATVHAALGGATQSVSVDMSNTYLDWAQRNFALNSINSDRHQLVQADCLKWLQQCRQGFDLIMLDPPTFSNSKRMEGVLDVQRDHVAMIKRCMELLAPGGKLYFSTNLRSFKLDIEALYGYAIDDISAQTIDLDFSRNNKIHRCFLVQQK
ncbi:MAG: class I SAM-dependent methyltransferase [Cellvibrionaceae bacterium]|nr:class I SAM-dependent methyltransferase [Cellvibrionaceae bacterium]